MNKADIPFLSATELGELIYKREVSPVETTEAYLERVDRLDSNKEALSAEEFLDSCLDLMGPVRVNDEIRQELIGHVEAAGPVRRGSTEEERAAFVTRVGEVLQLISSTREYQFG